MNLAIVYGFGEANHRRKWIAVDLGVSFGGDDLPGIDLTDAGDRRFLVEERRNLLGPRTFSSPSAPRRSFRRGARPVCRGSRSRVYATPVTAALLEAKRQSCEPGAPLTCRSRSCRWAGVSRSVPSTSNSSPWPIRSRNRTASSSAPRSAPCCIPAIGRSIRRRCWGRRPTSPSCARSATRVAWRWSAIPPMRCARAARPPRWRWPRRSPS